MVAGDRVALLAINFGSHTSPPWRKMLTTIPTIPIPCAAGDRVAPAGQQPNLGSLSSGHRFENASLPSIPCAAGDRVALLVNNLGSTTQLEMHGAAGAAARLVQSQLQVRRPARRGLQQLAWSWA